MSGTQSIRTGLSEPSSLEAIAHKLYAVLTDGHPALRFNIRRGYWLRDASGTFNKSSYTDEWRPARRRLDDGSEEDRVANPYVLLKHLQGNYDVAIQAPSWSSLIVLDIDRPEIHHRHGEPLDLEAELRADLQRDDMLAAVWRAFELDEDRQPVVLQTPGGGYHLYFPLDRPWPIAWARQWVEHHLHQRRLGLTPGILELYPSGVPLRAPCGRGSALLVPGQPSEPDDLGLTLRHAEWQERRDPRTGARRRTLVRDVPSYATTFLDRLEAARRPIEQWLSSIPAEEAWDPEKWGPWGKREKSGPSCSGLSALNQHKVEVKKAGTARSLPPPVGRGGFLLRGRAYRERIASLLSTGISSPGTRHDSTLKVTHFFGWVRGETESLALSQVEDWLRRPSHLSHTLDEAGSERFVRDSLREARHYYRTRIQPRKRHGAPRAPTIRPPSLSDADRNAIASMVTEDTLPAALAIMTYLVTFADDCGRVANAVDLASHVLEELCGQRRIKDADGRQRRAYVAALEELERAGIVAVHTDYSVGNHGRRYTVWYRFGQGALPVRDQALGIILGTRRVEEGSLIVTAGGAKGEPPRVHFRGLQPGLAEGDHSWWLKMYERRAFTPAEFFEAKERHVLPGPFRDRREKKTAATVALPSPSPSTTGGPGSSGPPEELSTKASTALVDLQGRSAALPSPANFNSLSTGTPAAAEEEPNHCSTALQSAGSDGDPSPLPNAFSRRARAILADARRRQVAANAHEQDGPKPTLVMGPPSANTNTATASAGAQVHRLPFPTTDSARPSLESRAPSQTVSPPISEAPNGHDPPSPNDVPQVRDPILRRLLEEAWAAWQKKHE